jgi:hypothetical protein
LVREDFSGQLPAVLGSHDSFQILENARYEAAVVVKQLGAIRDLDAGALADELAVGAFVDILKPAPSTDVIDQDVAVIGFPRSDVRNQLFQSLSIIERKAAAACVLIGTNDVETVLRRIGCDGRSLVSTE